MEIPTPSEPRMLTPPPQQIPFASFGDPELDSLCMEFYDETINEVNEIVKKNQSEIMAGEKYTSVPVPIHRSASHTPSMLVNAKKYLSDSPQILDCCRCHTHGETEITFKLGLFTWLCFFVILIFSILILPIFVLWVPFCFDSFKDAEHHCASCKAFVGCYKRIGKSI
uniref:LITAF domain-containing protein n=1 Tax=Rhabditophanes sp. KR3021 TaxID=114890 RepID=A0AC35TMN2_9BILA